MKIDLFERSVLPVLQKQLDGCALQNKVIASNIANIGTPNYKRLTVDFQKELSEAISEAKDSVDLSKKVEDIDPQIEIDPTRLDESGANNVDIDHEMADLAKNQLQFSISARIISDTIQEVDKSINGG